MMIYNKISNLGKLSLLFYLSSILCVETSLAQGINLPIDTCKATDYQYVLPKYTAGDPLKLGNTASDALSLVVFPQNATGVLGVGGTDLTHFTKNSATGSVWGIAFQASTQKIFAAAVLKRHAGLGPNGLGAIYVSDASSGDASMPMTTTKFVDLVSDFGINVGQSLLPSDRNLPAKSSDPSLDAEAFSLVGKIGLGDLDIDEAGQNLFVVNLHDKKFYKLNIAQGTAALPISYAIPNADGATGTTMRPWGLEIAGGKLYASVVYTPTGNGSVNDLSAAIYQFDLATETWATMPILQFPLNYPKGMAEETGPSSGNWNPWQDDYNAWSQHGDISVHPQPIFSDLELDSEGAFHLAFIDRAGHQVGNMNLKPDGSAGLTAGISAGDLLRTWNDNGVIRLETNAVAGNYVSSGTGTTIESGIGTGAGGPNSQQGPGNGEFYWSDNFGTGHSETVFGGIALHLSSKRLAVSNMNPIEGRTDAGGLRIYNTDNGATLQNYEVYKRDYGKASGLGDLELLCDPLPNADLSLTKIVDKPQAKRGETVSYTITVSNTGSNTANNIEIKDLLPSGLEYLNATASSGAYDTATGLWKITSLAVNNSASLTINTKAK